MLCKATQDRWVRVKSSETTWSTAGENGNPLQYSCPKNPMNSIKRQKYMTLEDEIPKVKRYSICYWERVKGNY